MFFKISAKKIFLILLLINALFIVLHLLSYFLTTKTDYSPVINQIAHKFNMNNEVSIPTWFAQTILLLTSFLFAYTAILFQKSKVGFKKTWWFLSGLFLYASIDEGSELHEIATQPFQEMFNITEGLLFFSWVIPGIIIFIILCIILIKFYLHLPLTFKIIFSTAAIMLFAAICVEMISGSYWQSNNFQDNLIYYIMIATEEGLENTSFIITIYGIIRFIEIQKKELLPKILITK